MSVRLSEAYGFLNHEYPVAEHLIHGKLVWGVEAGANNQSSPPFLVPAESNPTVAHQQTLDTFGVYSLWLVFYVPLD